MVNKLDPLLDEKPIRQSVRTFALRMEHTLRKHDKRRGQVGWRDKSTRWLLGRLKEEVKELEIKLDAQVHDVLLKGYDESVKDITREAADVANFAMMIVDNCGGLE